MIVAAAVFVAGCGGGSTAVGSPTPFVTLASSSFAASAAPPSIVGVPASGPALTPLPSAIATETASRTASAGRPSSPAEVFVTSPRNGTTVTGTTVHVTVAVKNAEVVQQTSLAINPTQGHVHLYVDNALVYMSYTLEQDLPVQPGTHTLRAEFVASDHAPFDPRVWSTPIIFTAKCARR